MKRRRAALGQDDDKAYAVDREGVVGVVDPLCAMVRGNRASISSVGHKLVALAKLAETDVAKPSFLDCFLRTEVLEYSLSEEFNEEWVGVRLSSVNGKLHTIVEAGICQEHNSDAGETIPIFKVACGGKIIFTNTFIMPEEPEEFTVGLNCDTEAWETLENDYIGLGEGGASFLFRFLFALCRHWGYRIDDQFGYYGKRKEAYQRYVFFREFWVELERQLNGSQILLQELRQVVFNYAAELPMKESGTLVFVTEENDDEHPSNDDWRDGRPFEAIDKFSRDNVRDIKHSFHGHHKPTIIATETP